MPGPKLDLARLDPAAIAALAARTDASGNSDFTSLIARTAQQNLEVRGFPAPLASVLASLQNEDIEAFRDVALRLDEIVSDPLSITYTVGEEASAAVAREVLDILGLEKMATLKKLFGTKSKSGFLRRQNIKSIELSVPSPDELEIKRPDAKSRKLPHNPQFLDTIDIGEGIVVDHDDESESDIIVVHEADGEFSINEQANDQRYQFASGLNATEIYSVQNIAGPELAITDVLGPPIYDSYPVMDAVSLFDAASVMGQPGAPQEWIELAEQNDLNSALMDEMRQALNERGGP